MKKLSKILESTWGDMVRRAEGEQVRKEIDPFFDRDVNTLSKGEFTDYLNIHYEFLMDREVMSSEYSYDIGVPIHVYHKSPCQGYQYLNITFSSTSDDAKELVNVCLNLTPREPSGLYTKMRKKFNIERRPKSHWSYITPLDGSKLTNSFCLEVIDFLMENVKIPLLKKKNLLKESTWGDMVKRAEGEQIREEDVLRTNIDEMKEVDLGKDFPVYWADIDLEVNGEDVFDWEETEKIIPQIEKTGWRLPKAPNEIYDMFGKDIRKKDTYLTREWIPRSHGVLSSKETGESLYFPTTNQYSESYWCNDDWKYHASTGKVNFENERCFDVSQHCYYDGIFSLIRMNNMNRDKKIKIRLVKDK